jgi:Leucine-rich repeat (LRR) protein
MGQYLQTLPRYTLESLLDSDSPQSLALQWLLLQDGVEGMAEWRRTQLFVLSTIYYSLAGPAWPFGRDMDWLDLQSGRTECDWYSKIYTNTLEQYDVQPCNEQGQFQSLRLENMELLSFSVSLPPEVELLTTLREIEISASGIQAELKDWIPAQVGNMAQLQNLYLHSNSFSGSLPAERLPQGLIGLSVSDNFLTGTLPSRLMSLTRLTELHLQRNSFSGTLPSRIGQLTELASLQIHHNTFSSTLPRGLTRLTKLEDFDASDNDFSGRISSDIGLLTSLRHLDMSSNSQLGRASAIPTELGLLSNLKYLSLSNNALSGTIPTEFGSLAALTGLYLGYNNLISIPSHIGLAVNLEKLELMNNALTGQLPSELGRLTALQELRVDHNSLKGSIPATLGRMTSLLHLALNSNQLTGSIPTELVRLATNLDFFDMRDNGQLLGRVPKELCGLESMNFDCTYLLCGCSCICTNRLN